MKNTFTIAFFLLSLHCFSQEAISVFDIARKGTLEQAQVKVKQNAKAFDVVNEEGYSPLVLACYRGNNDVAKFIIENGTDINGSSKMGTPLMAAIVKGNNAIATLLIKKKANLNITDENGTTALIYAVMFKNAAIIKLLLENKVDKTHKDKSDKTAFEHAVFSGNEEIINLLK